MSEKLDIFELLKAIDKRDIGFYSRLSPEEKKGFVPLVAMRWFSSTQDPLQLQLVNTVLNPTVFGFYKHPELMYKLFVACSNGKPERYSWIKKKGKDKSSPTIMGAIEQYFDCSREEAQNYRKLFTDEEILELVDILGYDNEQVKKVKAELK